MDHNWALWMLSVLIISHLNKKVEKWSMNSGINVTWLLIGSGFWSWTLWPSLLYCRLKEGLSRSILCVLAVCLWSHASSHEKEEFWWPVCCHSEYFFRPMHAAWTHFYTFIQGHEKPSDCLGLDQKSTEFLYLVTLCVWVTASTYSTNMYSGGHFRSYIIFCFVF